MTYKELYHTLIYHPKTLGLREPQKNVRRGCHAMNHTVRTAARKVFALYAGRGAITASPWEEGQQVKVQ